MIRYIPVKILVLANDRAFATLTYYMKLTAKELPFPENQVARKRKIY